MSLEVRIYKKFKGFTLDVQFTTEGGCTGILGASGCGKSMTLKCIAGIERPDSGRIVLDGTVLYDSEKKINVPVQQRGVGYLFQNYALFPTMTVSENLEIAVRGDKQQKAQKIQAQIQRFRLEGLQKHYPSQLSGGQQQRVAFARMLLGEPKMLMLDEPFSALDGYLKDAVQMEVLEMLEAYTGEVLMVSHSRDEIYKFCNRMVLLQNGKSIQHGDTREIFRKPDYMEAAKLTGCKNISEIERLGNYELYAKEWKITLKTIQKIDENIKYVGIRGHHLKPVCEAGENVMEVRQAGCAETPFEWQYTFQNAREPDSGILWWLKEKREMDSADGQAIPHMLYFPAEQLMLLK